MISEKRAHELINEHAEMRKLAFISASRALQPFFQEAAESASGIKTAAETALFDTTLLRHLSEP